MASILGFTNMCKRWLAFGDSSDRCQLAEFHTKAKTKKHKYISLGLLLIAIGFAAARFAKLTADPPTGITWAGVFYTDEGWYTKNARLLASQGSWFKVGGFNPAVALPVYSLVQYIAFVICGANLLTARGLSAIVFISSLSIVFLGMRKLQLKSSAYLAVALLSTNFALFTYSRVCLLEIPMILFVLLGLSVVLLGSHHSQPWCSGVAGLLIVMATLTKTTGVFAFIPLIVIMWLRSTSNIAFTKNLLIFCLCSGVALLAYYLTIAYPNWQDYTQFVSMNIDHRTSFSPRTLLLGSIHATKTLFRLTPLLWPATAVSAVFGTYMSESLRKSAFWWGCLTWVIGYMGIMSTTLYHPPRYFLPLLFPSACIVSVFLYQLWDSSRPIALPITLGTVLTLCLICNTISTIQYLSNAKRSYLTAARNIKKEMANHGHNALFISPCADTIGLMTDLSNVITVTPGYTLPNLRNVERPTYLLTIGALRNKDEYLLPPEPYELGVVSTYNVMDNYYTGEPMHLYLAEPSDDYSHD